MTDDLKKALDEAYAKYLVGCEKRNAPVIWDFKEWSESSIVAAHLRIEFWDVKDNI